MITLIGYIVVRDGMMEEALKLAKEIVLKVRETEPGTIDYNAYTSKAEGNENKIFWYETYQDESAMQLHRSNIASFKNKLGQVFDFSKNTITICDPIFN